MQCLGLYGRGDLDSLPAGDLAYVKLVGHLAKLGRRATAAEVEEYFAPYAPVGGPPTGPPLTPPLRALAGRTSRWPAQGQAPPPRASPLPLAPDELAA